MNLLIFGKKTKIKKVKGLGESANLHGYFDPEKDEIGIDDSLKGRDLLQTVIHEIGHSALHRTGITITSMQDDIHELVVDNIATALVENLSDGEVRSILKRWFG